MSDKTAEIDSELLAAFGGPAFASNRFFVTVGQSGVRIAFTEQWGESAPPAFRCAAVMGVPDAIQLKDLLAQLLRPLETEMAKSKISGEGNDLG